MVGPPEDDVAGAEGGGGRARLARRPCRFDGLDADPFATAGIAVIGELDCEAALYS